MLYIDDTNLLLVPDAYLFPSYLLVRAGDVRHNPLTNHELGGNYVTDQNLPLVSGLPNSVDHN